jgi:hypothetical protein
LLPAAIPAPVRSASQSAALNGSLTSFSPLRATSGGAALARGRGGAAIGSRRGCALPEPTALALGEVIRSCLIFSTFLTSPRNSLRVELGLSAAARSAGFGARK